MPRSGGAVRRAAERVECCSKPTRTRVRFPFPLIENFSDVQVCALAKKHSSYSGFTACSDFVTKIKMVNREGIESWDSARW
jgi:hypothetical protein